MPGNPQRKNELKLMLLKKAYAELSKEKQRKQARKDDVLKERIFPLPDLTSMEEEDLKTLCRNLHNGIDKVEDSRFDIEQKVDKNKKEIEDLNKKLKEGYGNRRPPLRRVKMSADQMLKALLGSKHKLSVKKWIITCNKV